MAELDLDFVRAQFPAFAEPSLAGEVFFENAGGSYPCRQVIDRLTRFYRERKVQPYAPYAASRLGGCRDGRGAGAAGGAPRGRDRRADLRAVDEPEHLRAGAGLPRDARARRRDRGDRPGPRGELGRLAPARRRRASRCASGGSTRERASSTPRGSRRSSTGGCGSSPSRTARTSSGETNPVAEIVAMAHDRRGGRLRRRGLHAPHGLPDVGALGADIYLFSTYKTYGPHQGVMVVRRALAEALPNQGHFFNAGVAVEAADAGGTRPCPGRGLRRDRRLPRRAARPPLRRRPPAAARGAARPRAAAGARDRGCSRR